jgi:hypothetical protein
MCFDSQVQSLSSTSWEVRIVQTDRAVLTTVLVFVIEQKLTEKPKDIVSVNGQVFDSAAKRLLENVIVRLHVSSSDIDLCPALAAMSAFIAGRTTDGAF